MLMISGRLEYGRITGMGQHADEAEMVITAKIDEDFASAVTDPSLAAANACFGHTTATRLAALPGHPAYNKAVLRWFEIIGEASRGPTDQFRHEHQQVPWREISDMRNGVTHCYFDIDLDVVWNTIMNDLPALEDAVVSWLPPSEHASTNN